MRYRILTILLFVFVASPGTAEAQKAKKPPSTIEALLDQVSAQTDAQIKDRAKQIAVLQTLYGDIVKTEEESLDNNIVISRRAAIAREAMITADEMLRDPDNKARVGELASYLRRTITRDQELFDKYVKQSETRRFQYERQLAKIKSQQTILRGIRRDLDRLRQYPTDKERTMFFLSSLSTVLDGLNALPGATP